MQGHAPVPARFVFVNCLPLLIRAFCRRYRPFMQTGASPIAVGGIHAALRAVTFAVAGLVCLASAPLTFAETKSQKKHASEDSDAPPPKKKPRVTPQPAPKPAQTPDASSANSANTKAKVKKPEDEPAASPAASSTAAPSASISTDDLVEFQAQPAAVKRIIESCLDLTRQNLTYTFGSCDPKSGGMDCSGFIYFVLRQHGFTQVPRDSSGQYVWVRRARGFRAVVSRKADTFEMDELLPGDLLFWTGTYATPNDPPVSHAMLYLGTEKSTGTKVLAGSSDGRSYRGQKRNGVSVFDFTMPRTPANGEQRSTFIGYGRIPGLRD